MTRKCGRGLPPSFLQEDIKTKKENIEACKTTKAAVMQGNPKSPNIVGSIVYDTKTVYYLIMVSSYLKWVVTEKYVFNVDTGRTETPRF